MESLGAPTRQIPFSFVSSYGAPPFFGREREKERIVASLRKACEGTPEFLLLTGGSGVGKTALLREMIPDLEGKGIPGWGKFDAGFGMSARGELMHAIRSILRNLLALPPRELPRWKARISDGLEGMAGVLIPALPELRHFQPEHEAPSVLEPTHERHRFEYLLLRLLRALGRDEPVILCLDDLQWADADSLKILTAWLGDPEPGKRLLIATVRSGETLGPAWLEFLDGPSGKAARALRIEPLTETDSAVWSRTVLGDSVEPGLISALFEATAGNPLQMRLCLDALGRRKYVRFDAAANRLVFRFGEDEFPEAGEPSPKLVRHALDSLSPLARAFLESASCVGSRFTLQEAELGCPDAAPHRVPLLREAFALGLLREPEKPYPELPTSPEQEFSFSHDQVRDTILIGLSQSKRQSIHKAIGIGLLARMEKEEDILSRISAHLDFARPLVEPGAEADAIARLHMRAARFARSASAFHQAFACCMAAMRLYPEDCWKKDYAFALDLHCQAVASGYMAGEKGNMEHLFAAIDTHAKSTMDKLPAIEIRIKYLIVNHKLEDSIKLAKETLKKLGLSLPARPNKVHAMHAVLAMQIRLAITGWERRQERPAAKSDRILAQCRIMSHITSAVFLNDPPLAPILMLAQLRISVSHGINDDTAFACAMFGLIQCGILHRYDRGARFGNLALELHAARGPERERARVFFGVHHFIDPWMKPLSDTLEPLENGLRAGLRHGDVEFAGHLMNVIGMTRLHAGNPLSDLAKRMEQHLEQLRLLNQQRAVKIQELYLRHIRALQGGDTVPHGTAPLVHILEDHGDRHGALLSHLLELIRCVHIGDFPGAVEAGRYVGSRLESLTGTFFIGWFRFYYALALAGGAAGWKARLGFWRQLRWLRKLASHAPENYLHKLRLVEGESLRMRGRIAEAKEAYTQALEIARARCAVDEESLAWGYLFRIRHVSGERRMAGVCLDQYLGSLRAWGASGLESAVRARYKSEYPVPARSIAPKADSDGLPLIPALTRYLASDGNLDSLLNRLLGGIVEMTGAHRACLIVEEGDGFRILSEVDTGNVPEDMRDHSAYPETLLRMAMRTGEAMRHGPVNIGDIRPIERYFQGRPVPSALCVPLKYRGRTEALLYLENRETPDGFPEADPWMEWIGGQAAITLRSAQFREERMTALRARINPHFLFNALTSIAYLTRSDPPGAEKGVILLAGLYRHLLESSHREWITLDAEIQCVKTYLEIEKIRFGERLRFDIDLEAGLEELLIPGLTIQPLVENAVKHSVEARREGRISIRARWSGGRCLISVANDGPEWGNESQPGTGEGIRNIQERMRLAFGDQGSLDYRFGSGVEALLSIPAERPRATE